MALSNPWEEPEEPEEVREDTENSRHCPRERARDHAGARDYQSDEDESSPDNLVQFPGSPTEIAQRDQPGTLRDLGDASKTWAREAGETARAAIDGSVYRSRPPSLRDMHARIQRGDWAGGVKWLYWPGLVFGYLSLSVTALGYGLLWVARRPSRSLVAIAITVLIVVLAI